VVTRRGDGEEAQREEQDVPVETREPLTSCEQLLTLREVARYLRVNERTVRRWVVREGLPCIHLGTRLRFSQRNVLRWVSAREEGR
jgi:excisionase family DNA binding protein